MRIEVGKGGIKHGAFLAEEGEIRVVDDELGKFFIAHSWATDADGDYSVDETLPDGPIDTETLQTLEASTDLEIDTLAVDSTSKVK